MKESKAIVSPACLQHIAIEVKEMDKSIKFYQSVLGMKLTERHKAYEIKAIPVELCFLRLGLSKNHHDLVLTHNPAKLYEPKEGSLSPNFHHMGFSFETKESWEAQLQQIRDLEIEVVRGPVLHSPFQEGGEGSWGENKSFYILDPDGHRIEFFCDMASVNKDGFYLDEKGSLIHEEARAEEF